LRVHFAGDPAPLTTKPKLVEASLATFPLYSRLTATTRVPFWVRVAFQ
jgi:hypothetical protein